MKYKYRYEVKINSELKHLLCYLSGEIKDAIMIDELNQLANEDLTKYTMKEDRKYYRKLRKAAKKLLTHYQVPE